MIRTQEAFRPWEDRIRELEEQLKVERLRRQRAENLLQEQSLTIDLSNAATMPEQVLIRQCLEQAAHPSDSVRASALGTLQTMAEEASRRPTVNHALIEFAARKLPVLGKRPASQAESMWADSDGVRAALLANAAVGQPVALRMHAIEALRWLAFSRANKLAMCADWDVLERLCVAEHPTLNRPSQSHTSTRHAAHAPQVDRCKAGRARVRTCAGARNTVRTHVSIDQPLFVALSATGLRVWWIVHVDCATLGSTSATSKSIALQCGLMRVCVAASSTVRLWDSPTQSRRRPC